MNIMLQNNAIQKDVDYSYLDEERLCVVRGRVTTNQMTPLLGVNITVINKPELGYTLSRKDGR